MSFELPDLPYAYDALAPYMSAETLEFHHDKHHQAYVTKGNELLAGSGLEGKSLEEIVKESFGKNAPLFNNAGQHYNHIHFWKWMKKDGGGSSLPGALASAIDSDLGGFDKFRADFIAAGVGQFGSGWAWLAVKDGKLEIMKTPNGENPLVHGAARFSAAMCGNTPITSTIAMRARSTSKLSSTAWSTGTTCWKCTKLQRSNSGYIPFCETPA